VVFINASENGESAVSDPTNAETLPKPLSNIDTPEGIKDVIERAANGDKAMQPLVRRLFDKDQRDDGGLLDLYGNSYTRARGVLIRNVAGKNLAAQEALRLKLNSVRDDLAGPNPTPLERILCERVALCWFDAHETDLRYVGN
jgi:hypothetical protein